MHFIVLRNLYSISRYEAESPIPGLEGSSDFCSITRTREELSVVASHSDSDRAGPESSRDWRVIKIAGPLELESVGVIAEISSILKERRIPVFTVSTYYTDYFLVKQAYLTECIRALMENNHIVAEE